MKVLQINQDPRPIILGYCLVLCERSTHLNIWVLLEKKLAKKLPIPILKYIRKMGWDLGFLTFMLHKTLLNPNLSHNSS